MTPDDVDTSFKALAVFSTMRADLATADAFLHRSFIAKDKLSDNDDLGFLGGKLLGRSQAESHHGSVMTIVASMLSQALENYLAMKAVKPTLEDAGIERFLDSTGDRDEFLKGMALIRNMTFHILDVGLRRRRRIARFQRICDRMGGTHDALTVLREALYDFTERCFMGELRIWPDAVYEDMDRLEEGEAGTRREV